MFCYSIMLPDNGRVELVLAKQDVVQTGILNALYVEQINKWFFQVATKNAWIGGELEHLKNIGTLEGFVEELNGFFNERSIQFTLCGMDFLPYLKWKKMTVEERIETLLDDGTQKES